MMSKWILVWNVGDGQKAEFCEGSKETAEGQAYLAAREDYRERFYEVATHSAIPYTKDKAIFLGLEENEEP
jgi:hypothetical protein